MQEEKNFPLFRCHLSSVHSVKNTEMERRERSIIRDVQSKKKKKGKKIEVELAWTISEVKSDRTCEKLL